MATSAQQQAFVTNYGPYANQAGSRLGISGNLVLAQELAQYGTMGFSTSTPGGTFTTSVLGNPTLLESMGYTPQQADIALGITPARTDAGPYAGRV